MIRAMRNSAIVLLMGTITMSPRPTLGDEPSPPGSLAAASVDVSRTGETYSVQITPARTGAHWFEVRYPYPRDELDAQTPGAPRTFGQPHHEAFGGKFRVETVEASTGEKIAAEQPQWSPMEIAISNKPKTCADRLEFRLRKGVEYKVRLLVDVAAPALQAFKPQFVVEPSDAIRHDAKRGGGWGQAVLGGSLALGITLAVVSLVRFLGWGAMLRFLPKTSPR